MPQSLSLVVVHVIFSTKDRLPRFDEQLRPHLHAYLATVARNAGCEAYRAGGVADHVHLGIRLARTVTIAHLVEELKTSSSKWLKTQSPDLDGFAWQRGYGCFSVGRLIWIPSAPTSMVRRSTIGNGLFKTSSECSSPSTRWNTTRPTFGIDCLISKL